MAGVPWGSTSIGGGSVPWGSTDLGGGSIPWGSDPGFGQGPTKRPSEQQIRRIMLRFGVGRTEALSMLQNPDFQTGDSNLAQLRQKKVKYQMDLMRRGMSEQDAVNASQVWEMKQTQGFQNPSSPLSMIWRILSVPGNFTAHIAKGVHDYFSDHASTGQWYSDIVNGLEVFPAIGNGVKEGFTNNPLGKYGWDDYMAMKIAEEPGNALYRNRIFQIGTQIAMDPTMYLSFGAGATAKIAALGRLADATEESYRVARIMKAKGPLFDVAGKEMNLDQIAYQVAKDRGLPLTVGDALTDLRAAGMQRKSFALRQPIENYQQRLARLSSETGRATTAQLAPEAFGLRAGAERLRAATGAAGEFAGSLLAPNAVLGGRGVRFAGMEIPGTPKLGEMLGTKTRAIMGGETATSALGALAPRWQVNHLSDDRLRAVAGAQVVSMRDRVGALQKTMKEQAINVARHDAGLVDLNERMGVMPVLRKQADYQTLSTAQKAITRDMRLAKGSSLKHADRLGVSDREINDIWEAAIRKHQDPVQALGEFRWRAESRLMQEEFVQEVLDKPMFALKWERKKPPIEERSPDVFYGDKHEIPQGFQSFRHRGHNYIIRNVIHDALDDFRNPAVLDKETKNFLRLVGKPQQWWKVYATTPNPAFHIMNFLGAVWNNLLNMVWSPMNYVDSAATLYRARLAEFAKEGRRNIIGVPTMTPTRAAAAKFVHEAEIRGGLGRGTSIFNELLTPGRQPTTRLPGEQPSRKRQVAELLIKKPGETKKAYAARQARRSVGGFGLATMNPVVATIGFAPEAARAGRVVGSAIEDVVRLAPFMKHARDPANIALLEAYGPIRVAGLKGPEGGISKAQQARLYDYGAAISKHFQFDYQDLTPFERNWAKTFFPFWVFYKNNFILQAGQLARAPRYIQGVQAMQNFISDFGMPLGPEGDMLPDYFSQLDAFQIPVPDFVRKGMGLSMTEPIFVNPKLPFVSLNLFPPFWDMFQKNGMNNSQKLWLSMSSLFGSVGPWAPPIPGAKIMFEAYVNKQLGLNQEIDYQRSTSGDLRQTFTDAPGWVRFLPDPIKNFFGVFPMPYNPFSPDNLVEVKPGQYKMTATSRYILEQLSTPFITNLGRSSRAVDPGIAGEKGTADLISWLTGLRLIPVDTVKIHREWVFKMRDMLNAERQILKKQGKDLSAEDLQALTYLNHLNKAFQASIDARDAELGH